MRRPGDCGGWGVGIAARACGLETGHQRWFAASRAACSLTPPHSRSNFALEVALALEVAAQQPGEL